MTDSSEKRGESPLSRVLKTVEDYRRLRQAMVQQAQQASALLTPQEALRAADAIEDAESVCDPWKVFAEHARPAMIANPDA